MILVTAVAVVLAYCFYSPYRDAEQSPSYYHVVKVDDTGVAPIILKKGWPGAMEEWRKDFVALVVKLDDEEEAHPKRTKTQFVDTSLVYDKIEQALDTFGMRAVYSTLFQDLEYYFPEDWDYIWDDDSSSSSSSEDDDDYCDEHGIGCTWLDLWWLYHYVGAISAEKLLSSGSLLLDGITRERVYDGIAVMKEIHRLQERPYASVMSFHAEHGEHALCLMCLTRCFLRVSSDYSYSPFPFVSLGFIWYYTVATMPNLHEYPTQLANDFCGDYLTNKVRSESAGKSIGYECYHGFGHAVYTVVAMRQIQQDVANYTARTQIRPHGGFALTDESFCETQRMCATAPNTTTSPQKACYGGIRHSYKLFSNTLPKFKDKYENRDFFAELDETVCSWRW